MTLDELFRSAADGCGVPGCKNNHGPMALSPRCHPGSGTSVTVDVSKGVMQIACAVCKTEIVFIKHTMSN